MRRHEFLAGGTAVLLMLAYAQAAWSLGEEDTAAYTMHFFSDVNGVNVFTHYSDYEVRMRSDLDLSLHWVHDVVIIPAIDAAPGTQEATDAITTASRPIADASQPYEDYVKKRNSLQGTVGYRGASAAYYVSDESDYFAQMITAGYNRDFLQDNLNLSGGLGYSWDEIRPLDDVGGNVGPASRRTTHGNLVATQILTPRTSLRVGMEFNVVHGQQHDPYRNVYAGGSIVTEVHPDDRFRRDLFLRVSRYFGNKSSLKADLRFYDDDWSVSSQTYGLKLSQYVTDDLVVRYRYRYYTQLAAYFYRDEYTDSTGVEGYRTGDYRLGDFGAHLFGGRVVWRPTGLLRSWKALDRIRIVFSYERYFNSNNFTANIYETGLQVSF